MELHDYISKVDPLAHWGAILSTLLALVKFFEIWQTCTQIDVSYNFTSDPDIGNEVIIRNLSNKPIQIIYWELLWQYRRWGRIVTGSGVFPDYDVKDIKVDAHSSTSIKYTGLDHFE